MDRLLVNSGADQGRSVSEQAIETAIADAAQLMAGMSQVRLSLLMTVPVPDEDGDKAAQAALARTRRALVEARWNPQLDL
jgi:hypothetical protein